MIITQIITEKVTSKIENAGAKLFFPNYRLQFPKKPHPSIPSPRRGEERQSWTETEWRSQEGDCPIRIIIKTSFEVPLLGKEGWPKVGVVFT